MREKTIFSFRGLIKGGLTVLISVLIIYGVAQASTAKITPPTGTPVANFYSLSEIYALIHDNDTSATAGSPALDWSAALEDTQYTLTEIYEELSGLIAAGQVKKDTVYLGVTGTLVPTGTAAATDCLDTKTFYSGNSWTQKTGSIANCSSEGGNACYAASGYWTASAGSNVTGADGSISFSIPNGYYSSKTCTAVDSDLVQGNIANGVNILGTIGNLVAGYLYGDSDASKVLTSATGNNGVGSYLAANLNDNTVKKSVSYGVGPTTGLFYGDTDPTKVLTVADSGGAAKGTYDASNLTTGNVRYGQSFGASGETGTMSPYPNTPSGISGLNQTVCSTASWTWVADSDYDGVSDDPICVQPSRDTASSTKVWNTSVANDNTFIGNYGCSGDTNGDGVGTLNTSLAGTVSENANFGNDAATALAIADCKDGIRNLLTAAAVESFNYAIPDTSCAGSGDDCYNGLLTPKALLEWKGTKLPSANDFFGVCGDRTASTTAGWYGTQIGRTDNVITNNQTTWEWLSEQYLYANARVAGTYACSYFVSSNVTDSRGFRVVFRP